MTADLATFLLRRRLAVLNAEHARAARWERLTRLDALITICPVCDQRVIEAHGHAVRRTA